MIRKILFRLGNLYYWTEGDLHTNSGVVKEEDLKTCKNRVNAHSGKEFLVFDANFIDQLEKLKRGPAVMTKKDMGIIIANTGIDKESTVLDAGTGCGMTAALIARLVKKVVTYEKNKDFFNLAKKNFEFLDIKNVEQKNKDVYEGIDEKNLDLVVLDLPEPWQALKHAHKAIKSGCFLVAYLPTITQVNELLNKTEGFLHEKTIEVMEREWHIEGKKVRPKSQMTGHTGFLAFLRRI